MKHLESKMQKRIAWLLFALLCCVLIEAQDQVQGAWSHPGDKSLKSQVQKSAQSLLTLRRYEPLQVPLEVNVLVIGFAADGGYRFDLPAAEFELFLQNSFPSYQPSCLETSLPLEIRHALRYNVNSVTKHELVTLERVVQGAMVSIGQEYSMQLQRFVQSYEVEATGLVEAQYAALYEQYFGSAARGREAFKKPGPIALFLVNLDKVRMNPQVANTTQTTDSLEVANAIQRELSLEDQLNQEGGYVYRYRYQGGGQTAAWLSSDRFAVVDISAGPCAYGRVGATEGVVAPTTVPRLRPLLFPRGQAPADEEVQLVRKAHFRGQLSTLVVSAVQHLFAPDIRLETVDSAERVLVSITVLRNHQKFNPFYQKHNHSIDLEELQTQIKRLAQPNQEVLVVGAVQSLHEHPQLALALSTSIRGVSVHLPVNGSAVHRVQGKNFLDGVMLMNEMGRSGDLLASALLEVSHPGLSKQFFTKEIFAEPDEEASQPVGPAKTRTGQSKEAKTKQKKGTLRGTRVIPVYVLSLAGMESGLLMRNDSLVAADGDAVVVLQTVNDPAVPTSFMSEKHRMTANPMSPTRHILAGVGLVLGALAPPYHRVVVRGARPLSAPVKGHSVENWLWASGHHPFGPFSNCSSFSDLQLDTVARNAIYSRVDTAIKTIRGTLQAIDAFTAEYVTTPYGDLIKSGGDTHWLQKLYTDKQRSVNPLPELTVQTLNSQLEGIEALLVEMSGMLYDHKMTEAHSLSSALLSTVTRFHQSVEEELASARDSLSCCRIKHERPADQSQQALLYLFILGAGFIVYFVVIFFSTPKRQ